jgi:hypothetical protein
MADTTKVKNEIRTVRRGATLIIMERIEGTPNEQPSPWLQSNG